MISESRAKELLNKHLAEYCKRLNINHWEIRTKNTRLDDKLMGQIDCSSKYCDAVIAFDLSQIDSEKDFLETLQHELVHCVVADMDMARDAAYVGLSSTEIGMFSSIYTDALERTVGRVQRIIFKDD